MREQISSALRANLDKLGSLGIASIAVFGSVARDEATHESDVDLLVEFTGPVGLFEFNRIRRRLEELVGHPVDLVTRDALHPALAENILREAVPTAPYR